MAYSPSNGEFDSASSRHRESREHRHSDSRASEYASLIDRRGAYTTLANYADTPPTYGTYIWPLDMRGYSSSDPTRCTCTCCPHPFHVTGPGDGQARHAPGPHIARHESSGSTKPASARRSKYRRCDVERIEMDVVNNSGGSLWARYGRTFPISIHRKGSMSDVVSFLVPDKRHGKVLVHWDDGKVEHLGDRVPFRELEKYAMYLEVRDKKRVHWA